MGGTVNSRERSPSRIASVVPFRYAPRRGFGFGSTRDARDGRRACRHTSATFFVRQSWSNADRTSPQMSRLETPDPFYAALCDVYDPPEERVLAAGEELDREIRPLLKPGWPTNPEVRCWVRGTAKRVLARRLGRPYRDRPFPERARGWGALLDRVVRAASDAYGDWPLSPEHA
jgi:hypothetical protein